MPNTYSKLYAQSVFAVKYRKTQIRQDWKNELFSVIGNLINETGCKTYIVNGVSDHVHCLFGFKPIHSISKVMQSVKAKSSKWVNEQDFSDHKFEWQDGFGVFSYSDLRIDQLYTYIQNQEQHHKTLTFRQEYILMLKKHKIEFDERYIFHDLI
jgi:REP element-mobilizing transposase RayT